MANECKKNPGALYEIFTFFPDMIKFFSIVKRLGRPGQVSVVVVKSSSMMIHRFSIPLLNFRTGELKNVTVAAILPCNNSYLYSIERVKDALSFSVEKVREHGLLPNHRIQFFFADSGPNIYYPLKHVSLSLGLMLSVSLSHGCYLQIFAGFG